MTAPTLLPLLLSRYTATTCLGQGLDATFAGLERQASGLRPCDFETATMNTWIGPVDGVDEVKIPEALVAEYDCRNNRLALLGLQADGFEEAARAAISRYGASRVGLFLGTSTSSILETEIAFRHRNPDGSLPSNFRYRGAHNAYSVAAFVRDYLGLQGPASVISTACSSSAKVFAQAQRMIALGLIDAALVGGIDCLCLTTLYGFSSLELTSPNPCRPYDGERDGISIGEGAAYALLERCPDSLDANAVLLLGCGESSDAYHMSSPHPEGLGAKQAMEAALAAAKLSTGDIDYINLHGTATPSNDSAEGKAVMALFGTATPCSSTKGATGHTLGAAGAVEAVVSALALTHGLIPGSPNTVSVDPALSLDYALTPRHATLHRVLSNSFGFGGSNCSLVFGAAK